LKHKTDSSNPLLLSLAECLGVVSRSNKLEFEMMEFARQIKWIRQKFVEFVQNIYEVIDRAQVSELKIL
jgi:hypothetical protein